MADDAQTAAQDAAARVREQAQAAAQQAQAAVGQTQDRLREQADLRSTQAGQQINAQASDLREVSDALREQGQDAPARLADRLAGYAEQAGVYLEDNDAEAILSDAEDLGRQHPGTVAAGALVLGFAASRFLKASGARRYSSLGQPSAGASAGSGTRPLADSDPADIEPAEIVPSDVVPGTHPREPLPGGIETDVVAGTANEGI